MISFKQFLLESFMKTHKGSIDISNLYLTKLPKFLEDITVDGYFSCYNNNLTSLEHCPKIVKGNFYCFNNNLTSLEHCPKEINGSFNCSNNNITFLEHCPKKVNGNFYCDNNTVEFTEEYVRSLCDVKGEVYV